MPDRDASKAKVCCGEQRKAPFQLSTIRQVNIVQRGHPKTEYNFFYIDIKIIFLGYIKVLQWKLVLVIISHRRILDQIDYRSVAFLQKPLVHCHIQHVPLRHKT